VRLAACRVEGSEARSRRSGGELESAFLLDQHLAHVGAETSAILEQRGEPLGTEDQDVATDGLAMLSGNRQAGLQQRRGVLDQDDTAGGDIAGLGKCR